jgi:hypothetical protein
LTNNKKKTKYEQLEHAHTYREYNKTTQLNDNSKQEERKKRRRRKYKKIL